VSGFGFIGQPRGWLPGVSANLENTWQKGRIAQKLNWKILAFETEGFLPTANVFEGGRNPLAKA
jgi:hypothetical protein